MSDAASDSQQKKKKHFNFALPFIIVSGLLGIGGFLLLRVTAQSGVAERRGFSAKNLHEMGRLLEAAGFPDDPNTLLSAPEHAGLTINPSWPEQVGYVYVRGIKASDDGMTVVMFENVPPEKRRIGRQILLRSGKVELTTEDDFQKRKRDQEQRWSAENRPWQLVPVGKDRSEDAAGSM